MCYVNKVARDVKFGCRTKVVKNWPRKTHRTLQTRIDGFKMHNILYIKRGAEKTLAKLKIQGIITKIAVFQLMDE